MAAVIRPVGIQHTDLRDRGIAVHLPVKISVEVAADKLKIRIGHCKPERIIKRTELFLRHGIKSRQNLHILRNRMLDGEGLRLLHAGLSRIHRVDAVTLDAGKLLIRYIPLKDISHCCADGRRLMLVDKLQALHRGIRALVKLSRNRLHAEHTRSLRNVDCLMIENIDRRLGEYGPFRQREHLIRNILHIVPDQLPDLTDSRHAEKVADVLLQCAGSPAVGLLLLHIDSPYTHAISSI